jgi:hypothetical protein
MTLDAFLDNLHKAKFAPVAHDLLTRTMRYATERGQWYASGNSGGPNVRTGTLRTSIRGVVTSDLRADLRATVPYAGFVERGTRKMRARPYLSPAIADTQAAMPRLWPPVAKKWKATLIGKG